MARARRRTEASGTAEAVAEAPGDTQGDGPAFEPGPGDTFAAPQGAKDPAPPSEPTVLPVAAGPVTIIPAASARFFYQGVLVEVRPGIAATLEPAVLAALDQIGTPYTRA